ncbi:MAG: sulfotransferase [Alphaproteobacteria bacterium]
MIGHAPILIFGLPRSGTSWIARIFDSHPDTLYRHEPDDRFLDSGLPVAPDPESIAPVADRARAYLESCLALSHEKHVGSPPYWPKSYRSTTVEAARTTLIYGLKGLSRLAPGLAGIVPIPDLVRSRDYGRVRLVWKSVVATTQLSAYARLLPEARCILILRHPGGQFVSRMRGMQQGHLPSVPASAATDKNQRARWLLEPILRRDFGRRYGLNWDDVERAGPWERAGYAWAIQNQVVMDGMEGLGNIRFVRYEDVAVEPERAARDLFDFTRLEWCEQTAAFVRASSAGTRRGNDPYFGVYRDSRSQIDKWRQTLDDDSVARLGSAVCHFPVGRLYAESFALRRATAEVP